MRHVMTLTTAMLLATVGNLPSQTRLEPGARIRIESLEFFGEGELKGIESGRLLVATEQGEVVQIPQETIRKLGVRRESTRNRTVLETAGFGLAVGGLAGAAYGFALGETEKCDFYTTERGGATVGHGCRPLSRMDHSFQRGAAVGFVGMVVGSLVGLVAPTYRWVDVSPRTIAGLSATADRGLQISVAALF